MARREVRCLALGVLCLIGTALGAAGEDAGFSVRSATTALVNDIYMVDVRFDYEFSDESLEALANGITLTVNVEVEFLRERSYLWDALVARAVQGYRLQRHELSNQYLVTNTASGRRRNFSSLDEAVAALGAPEPIPVIERRRLDSAGSYRARVRTRLDIEALPAPMRPVAYLKAGWRLSSGWHGWDFDT